MTERQKDSSFPHRLLLRLRNSFHWPGALALLILVAIAVMGASHKSTKLVAATALNYSHIDIQKIDCLSIDPQRVVFNEKKHPADRLIPVIAETLAMKSIHLNADLTTCPWGLSIVGEKTNTFAVRYGNQIARYLVSVAICERDLDGRLKANECLSKNIYAFDDNIRTDELFSLALVGLAKEQVKEWEVFQVKRH